jgi:Golgi SNAP receptor complex protein 1
MSGQESARSLEQETEEKISQFATSGIAQSSDIQELLERRKSLLNSLPHSHRTSRHFDILSEHRREVFNLIDSQFSQLQQLKTRESLIPINDHPPASWQDTSLMNERSRIDSSHQMADQVLQQAYQTQDSLRRQQSMLGGATGRLTSIASKP